MTLSACLTIFWILCVAGLLFMLALALCCCVALRANFRLFVIGMAGFTITDLLAVGVNALAEKWSWLGAIYKANEASVTLTVLFVQALVLALCAFLAIRFFRVTKGYYFRQGFTIGSGMAAMMVYMTYIRPNISNIILISGYQLYLGGSVTDITEEEAISTKALVEELLATPQLEMWMSILEFICISAAVIAVAYLAVTAILSRIRTNLLFAAGIYFVYTGAIYFINTNTGSMWIRLAFEAVCAAGAVMYIVKNYAPTPPRRTAKLK